MADQRFGGVQSLFGDTVLGVQPAVALHIDLGIFQLGLVLQQRAFGLQQGILITARVDLSQQFACLDHLPFLEIDLDQFPCYTAAHIDGVQCGHRAQRLVVNREIALRYFRHPHRHGLGRATKARAHHARATGVPGGLIGRSLFCGRRP